MTFEAAWKHWRPDSRPIGFLMREAGAGHWVRLHSLPGSKRYADTPSEQATVLARSNTLAGKVLGEDGDCWLVQARWTSFPAQVEGGPTEYGLEPAMRFPDPGAADDAGGEWTAWAGPVTWRSGLFDRLLLDIADDRAAPTLWMSVRSGAVFAPYDGGVDLFLPAAEEVAALRAAHADWLSSDPHGL